MSGALERVFTGQVLIHMTLILVSVVGVCVSAGGGEGGIDIGCWIGLVEAVLCQTFPPPLTIQDHKGSLFLCADWTAAS